MRAKLVVPSLRAQAEWLRELGEGPALRTDRDEVEWWKRRLRVLNDRPHWDVPLERGPTPISKGWKESL